MGALGGSAQRRLAPAHEVDDLELIAVLERRCAVLGAGNDGLVALDRYRPSDLQMLEQLQHGQLVGDLFFFSVDGQVHGSLARGQLAKTDLG